MFCPPPSSLSFQFSSRRNGFYFLFQQKRAEEGGTEGVQGLLAQSPASSCPLHSCSAPRTRGGSAPFPPQAPWEGSRVLGTASLSLGGCFIGSVPTPSTTLAAQGEMCEQGRCSVGVTSCHLDRCKPCPAVTSSLLLAGSSKGSLGTAQLEAWGGFCSQSLGAEGTSWCCTSIQQQHSANTPGGKGARAKPPVPLEGWGLKARMESKQRKEQWSELRAREQKVTPKPCLCHARFLFTRRWVYGEGAERSWAPSSGA